MPLTRIHCRSRPDLQLDPAAGLLGVPAGDGAADQVGEVAGEPLDEVAGDAVGVPLHELAHASGRSAASGRRRWISPGDAGPQLGVRVGGRGEDGVLRVGPQRARPGADGGVLEQLLLQLLDPGGGVRVGAQGVHVGAQPGVVGAAQLVPRIGRRPPRGSPAGRRTPGRTPGRRPSRAPTRGRRRPAGPGRPAGSPAGSGPAARRAADSTSWCRSPSTTSSSTRARTGAAGVSCSLRSTRSRRPPAGGPRRAAARSVR